MRLAIAAAIILIVPAARAECPPEMTPQECSERIQNGISFVSNGYGDTTNSQERSGSWGSRLWRDRIPTGGSGDDESLPAWRRRVRDATAATPLNESERLSAARIEHAVVQKDYPAAREEVENYRRYNPGAPISYQWGAEVAAEQGDRAGALREVEQGLKAAPGDPGLTQLQKFLRPKVDESSTAGLQGKMDSFMKAARAGSDLSAELDSARSVQRFAPAASERGGERGSAEASPLAHAVMAGAGPALGAALPRASPRISPSRGSVAGLDAARDERQASRAIAENQKDAQAWAARALSRRAEGDLQGALQDAARAASLAPEDPRAGKLLAMVLIDLRRYPEARARLNRALSEEPRDAEALNLRAITFEREGKPARMLMDLRRAARIDPERFAKLYQEALAQYGVQASGGRQAEEPAAGAAGSPRTPPWAFPAVAAILIALAALREVSGSSARGAAPAAVLSRAAATPPAAVEEIELVRPIGEGGMG
ncbi:MAG TPA: tetratricopeptide repeat protein, partial [Elusimicrobiota bacterium]|nr:tetratricopeptide repeat protein [Elusimicrobiota bacterium]